MRAAASHLEDAARAGGVRRLVVVDDGRNTSDRAARAAVTRSAEAAGTTLAWWDRRDRERLARDLARSSGADEHIVRFCLLGDPARGPTHGAARNSLLLLCAGRPLLSVDDDTVGGAFGACPRTAGAILSEREPSRMTFHGSRDEALRRAARAKDTLFEWHRQYLGRAPSSVVELRGAGPLARRCRRADARVVVTHPGLVGDSGFSSALGLTINWPEVVDGGTRRSTEAWRRARVGRQIVRLCPAPALTWTTPLMGFSLGLDARVMLPPFPPVLRNEDGVFGALLDRLAPGAVAMHLPRALLHDAGRAGGYEIDPVVAAGRLRWGDLLSAIARDLALPSLRDPAKRMRAAGAQLASITGGSERRWIETAREAARRTLASRARALEENLARYAGEAPTWAADARACLAAVRAAEARDELDLASDLRLSARRPVARDLAHSFGRLLEAWPDLWEHASALAAGRADA